RQPVGRAGAPPPARGGRAGPAHRVAGPPVATGSGYCDHTRTRALEERSRLPPSAELLVSSTPPKGCGARLAPGRRLAALRRRYAGGFRRAAGWTSGRLLVTTRSGDGSRRPVTFALARRRKPLMRSGPAARCRGAPLLRCTPGGFRPVNAARSRG